MVVSDPVGDLLTRIRNAVMARKKEVVAPYSKLRHQVLTVLVKEGYLEEVEKEKESLTATLAYRRRQSVISGLRRISRPGVRVYRQSGEITSPLGGAGLVIISTSRGIMSGREAKKLGLGGEVLGEVW